MSSSRTRRPALTLSAPERIEQVNSTETYASLYTVQADAPVLVRHEGSAWRLAQLLVTDTGYVWVTFIRQTAAGRDYARGGHMTYLLDSTTPAYRSVRESDPEVAEVIDGALALRSA